MQTALVDKYASKKLSKSRRLSPDHSSFSLSTVFLRNLYQIIAHESISNKFIKPGTCSAVPSKCTFPILSLMQRDRKPACVFTYGSSFFTHFYAYNAGKRIISSNLDSLFTFFPQTSYSSQLTLAKHTSSIHSTYTSNNNTLSKLVYAFRATTLCVSDCSKPFLE